MAQKFSENVDLTLLRPLFPASAHCVFSSAPPDTFKLHASEENTTTRMSPVRLRDFGHGRACARLALKQLEVFDCPVPVGKQREPLWPNDIVGSLSHTNHFAAAVVARRSEITSLGIDLEPAENLPENILARVCRAEEIERLSAGEEHYRQAKLIFSAKESLYKCLWPIRKSFIGFQEMEITLFEQDRSWSATSHTDLYPESLVARLRGRYLLTDELIISSSYILAEGMAER